MEMSFRDGDVVLASSLPFFIANPKIGDVVVVLKKGKYILKRIAQVKEGKFFVVGDNRRGSTDSRSFGWINRNAIIGKVIYKI